VSGAEAGGPGRRLTPEEEARGAAMFAAGASDRQVADALGIGTGTANRLRHRAGAPVSPEEPAAPGPRDDGQAGELARLRELREAQAEAVRTFAERAAAQRLAVEQLDAERLAAIDEGRDAAPLRPRMRDARADLEDSEVSAALAHQRLRATDAEITRIGAERDAAAAEAQLEAAVAEGMALAAGGGAVLRSASDAVAAAAASLVAFRRDVAAAQDRIRSAWQAATAAGRAGAAMPVLPDAALPAPVPGMTDAGLEALAAAWAQAGIVAAGGSQFSTATPLTVAGQLARSGGAYGRLAAAEAARPAEEARARRLAAHRAAELAQLMARQAAGPGVVNLPPGARPLAAVGLDNGRPVPPDPPLLRPGDHPAEYMPWLNR